jgi:hypothetical protein
VVLVDEGEEPIDDDTPIVLKNANRPDTQISQIRKSVEKAALPHPVRKGFAFPSGSQFQFARGSASRKII